ncbi:MAG: hypothetical protein ACI32Q_12295 [Intestinibaculum porci]|uniref:hypothetical protein n=1 Tax=Intestinibaculum porci TaxID=2487118 RepID=UPI003F11F2B1
MDRYMRSAPYNMLHICVDVASEGHIAGRVYNPTIKENIVFRDVNELFLKADQLFDRNGNPMPSSLKRSFTPRDETRPHYYQRHPAQVCEYRDLLVQQGKVITLDLVVLTRHLSSWQGYLFYEDQTYEFKEVLEIVKIINKLLNL